MKTSVKIKKHKVVLLLGFLACLSLIFGLWLISGFSVVQEKEMPTMIEVQKVPEVFLRAFERNTETYDVIRKGENLEPALKRLKTPQKYIEPLISAFGKHINLRSIQEGTGLMVKTYADEVFASDLSQEKEGEALFLVEIFIKDSLGIVSSYQALIDDNDKISIKKISSDPEKRNMVIYGNVSDSLYVSMLKNNADPQLVNNFADIFGSQVDFYRETKDGDQFQLLVEENIVDGRKVGFGQILAASYQKPSKIWQAFYYESKDGLIKGYYDENGDSLKNAFLKAPLKLAQITSRFGMRFHPVQKRMKPHNGVDYGAAKGTPIMAVANGIVVNAGYTPFNGNWVRVRHINGYETEYLHATNLAKGIRVGARVNQGQVIAFVGKTGLASGYHLHFGMKLNGKYINPSSQKFAQSEKLAKKYLEDYKQKAGILSLALLNSIKSKEKMAEN